MDQIGPKLDHKGLKIVVLRFFAEILFVQYALSKKPFCIIFQPDLLETIFYRTQVRS